jgi:hypothetical protein
MMFATTLATSEMSCPRQHVTSLLAVFSCICVSPRLRLGLTVPRILLHFGGGIAGIVKREAGAVVGAPVTGSAARDSQRRRERAHCNHEPKKPDELGGKSSSIDCHRNEPLGKAEINMYRLANAEIYQKQAE